ncbi:MAG: sigma-70 family RNA polymerase sigma factor [Victivallaceae bacterium]
MNLETKTDGELVKEFKDGNTAVFDLLIARHASRMYGTAYALLSDHHDAEEVVQDAFVRAYRSLNSFRGDSNLGTWLHRIVSNLARNKYHWNRRRGANVNISIHNAVNDPEKEKNENDMPLPDCSRIPDRQVENSEIEQCLTEGMAKLPESLRETMILRHVQDMSYEKIAEALDCKVGTVKSRIARGREILREIMNKFDVC